MKMEVAVFSVTSVCLHTTSRHISDFVMFKLTTVKTSNLTCLRSFEILTSKIVFVVVVVSVAVLIISTVAVHI
jgi:hypothetical protein